MGHELPLALQKKIGRLLFQGQTRSRTEQFNAALREAGFGVNRGQIVDVSGWCPGFAVMPATRSTATPLLRRPFEGATPRSRGGLRGRNAGIGALYWRRESGSRTHSGAQLFARATTLDGTDERR
jgi:hypothetical protein